MLFGDYYYSSALPFPPKLYVPYYICIDYDIYSDKQLFDSE